MAEKEIILTQFNDGVGVIHNDSPERRAYISNFGVDNILLPPLNYYGQKSFHPTQAMLDEQNILYNYLRSRIAATPQERRFYTYKRMISRYAEWASNHAASSSFNPEVVIG